MRKRYFIFRHLVFMSDSSPPSLCHLSDPQSPPPTSPSLFIIFLSAAVVPPSTLTHTDSPLIGRLPQVAVEPRRAPQKRRLMGSALVSSHCDRKKKPKNKKKPNTPRPATNQVEVLILFYPDESSVAGT